VHTQEPVMKLLVVAALAALVAVVSASGDPTESLPGVQDLSELELWSRVEASGGRTAMQRAAIALVSCGEHCIIKHLFTACV
jgi:hypothetical protein